MTTVEKTKSKKLIEQKNHCSCTNKFLQKILTGAIFLLAPVANHGWYKVFSYWLHETAACCCFGVDLGNGLDHYSLSRLADGTPYSSSDLLYFTLLLPFLLGQISLSPTPFLLFRFEQKIPESNSSPLFSSDKNILIPTPTFQKYSKTIPNSVLAASSIQSRKNDLSPIFFLT